jgi:hypothetical protein
VEEADDPVSVELYDSLHEVLDWPAELEGEVVD